MRNTPTVLVLAFVTLMLTVASRAAWQQQPTKPVKVHLFGTRFRAPAETLVDTILQADVVVRGQIVGSKPADTTDHIVTAFRFQVLEVLHTPGGRVVNASEIEILRAHR